jgi:hypothetical protein
MEQIFSSDASSSLGSTAFTGSNLEAYSAVTARSFGEKRSSRVVREASSRPWSSGSAHDAGNRT